MEKNKRNKIIGLSIGILIVLIIVVSSTYAYWQITKTQETPNDIVAACLDLNLEDKSAAIDLDSAWPISDEEGKKLTGYTFTVTNNCNEEINYIVGLNRVEEENHLQDSSIKLQLDDNSAFLYSDLSDVEYVDPDNTEYTARSSKQVSVETIGANGTNTHTIRVWVSSDAPVTEQSKKFQGQVFITGGQGIEVPSCFAIDIDGTILGYDTSCGLEVKVPAEINGIQVKKLRRGSFGENNLQVYMLYNEETEEEFGIYYYTDENTMEQFVELMKQQACEDPETCTLEDIEASGLKIITSEEEYNNFEWSKYKVEGPELGYFDLVTGEFDVPDILVTSLDLSDAVYLETIQSYAVEGKLEYDTAINDTCKYDGATQSYNCNASLKEVVFPKNGMLTTIEEGAFKNNQLNSIEIPNSVNIIGERAFADNEIDELKLPNSFQILGDYAFEFNNIKSIEIAAQTIGKGVFQENNLESVLIKSSVQTINDWAFYGFYEDIGLKNVTFEDTFESPSQLQYIGKDAFRDNELSTVKFPRNLKTIASGAFVNNDLQGTLVIPNSITNIEDSAFNNTNLTEVIIKNTEGSVNISASAFPSTTTITYDPNYIE